MRTHLALAAFIALAACSPPAQEAPDTTIQVETPAPAPAPVVVLTEPDARARLESSGYTAITGLTQNADGSWSATGTKDGATAQLTVTDSGVTVATTPAPTTP